MKSTASFLGLLAFTWLAPAVDFLPPGRRPLPPGTHALVGGRVVVKPGTVVSNATILVRDGLITAAGATVAVPADARVWDMKGTTIYAGFIDAYLALGDTNPPVTVPDGVPVSRSHDSVASLGSGAAAPFLGVIGDATDRGERGPGADVPLITPQRRMFDGLAPASRDFSSLRELGFTSANIVPARGILRGTGALVNLREANPNEIVLRPDVFQHVAFEIGRGREGEFPASLMGVIAVVRQSFFDARHYAFAHTHYAANPAGTSRPEFNPALEALRPAVYEQAPVCVEPGSVLMVDRAARLAQELSLEVIITASGNEWRRPDLVKATGARFIVPLNLPTLPRLPRDDDWADIDLDRLRAWDWAAENPAVLRRAGREIALTTYSLSARGSFRRNLRAAIDRGLSEDDALAALTTAPASFCGVADRLGTIESGKIANLTVVEGSYFDPDKKVREVWIDGRVQRVEIPPVQLAITKAATPAQTNAAPKKDGAKKNDTDTAKKDTTTSTNRTEQARAIMSQRAAREPLAGRGPLATPHAVLIRNATVWTCGPDGRLERADVLVRDGKIEAVGRDLNVPGDLGSKTLVIEGEGKHVTPGLIDCHSHTAILGGVNEFTLPSSAMVRVGDVVNSETPTFYEQLAGGLTCANLLHGSANPIGGQNAVIKLRDGAGPEELKLASAPPGIKFALGENVKQANSERNRTRFPQTRMGVETFFENRFEAARQYLAGWAAHRAKGGLAPRRDLELEALGEILEGKRLVHCHSYRQDEILAFLRVCERFGVKIATLQHILEGYKVADEIAKHGAGASAFSDWWAYKFEVIDAIPYAGSLMRDRGVLVSFNSDSSELARRMNLEAAKAVKYGGTPEEEALKFVTINPAKQLRIDQRVGSLEAGKDADFALWSGSPLDSGSICLETWIDGKKYFDRELAGARAAELAKERTALIAKAKKVAAASTTGTRSGSGTSAFFARALEQMHSITECGECALRRELQ